MKKAYVMQSFDGFSDPRLDLIMDNNGNVVNNREDAFLIAESFAEMFSTRVTDVLVFEIEAKDVSIYDALEYTEEQVVGLFRNSTRIMHGKNIVHVGRMAVDAGNIAVCGNPGFSFEVMGIGETTEKALREAWDIMYKEEYTGSEEQLDRLNSDCAISTATISQAAEDLVRDGYHDLDECDLIFHQTYKDRYEICTRKEYIHMLMTDGEDNIFHWD